MKVKIQKKKKFLNEKNAATTTKPRNNRWTSGKLEFILKDTLPRVMSNGYFKACHHAKNFQCFDSEKLLYSKMKYFFVLVYHTKNSEKFYILVANVV